MHAARYDRSCHAIYSLALALTLASATDTDNDDDDDDKMWWRYQHLSTGVLAFALFNGVINSLRHSAAAAFVHSFSVIIFYLFIQKQSDRRAS